MSAQQADVRFDRFLVKFGPRQVLADGEPVRLGARAFDLLSTLIQNRDRTVSKQELLNTVWPGVVVEENNLQVQISTLRKLLGPQAISTIPGRGYRFTLPLTGENTAGEPSAPVPSTLAGNLPDVLPELFGREDDLRAVQELLGSYRFVTVAGAGGIGKTRLAQAAAHALQEQWADGAWIVDLAPVADAGRIASAVAQTLGLQLPVRAPGADDLVAALRATSLLLVLDNCEHQLQAWGELVQALLAHAPGVTMLATSQEPVHLPDEHVYRLDTLAVPSPAAEAQDALHCGAVALFVARAQAADPRFTADPPTLAAVIEICRHLDGIPLAIELAAARVPLLGIAGLRDRLDERFRVLTAGSRFALRRHQTLHAALDWSYGLLAPDERLLLRRLGVFAGGWTLEAAQLFAADEQTDKWTVLEHLGALVDKSLVVARGNETPRYLLLETTRAYALEQLARAGETAPMLRRHAQVVLDLLVQADEGRWGEQGTLSQAAVIEETQPEIDNLRAAFAWATGPDGDESLAIGLTAASAISLYQTGLAGEACAMLATLAPRVGSGIDPTLSARFWFAAAMVGHDGRIEDGLYQRALDRAEQGCRDRGWQRRVYKTLLARAWRHIGRHEFAAGEAALSRAIDLEQPRWPGWLLSDRWNTNLYLLEQTDRLASQGPIFETIASLLPRTGEEGRQVRLTLNQAVHWHNLRQWERAIGLLGPLIDRLRRQRGHLGIAAWALGHIVLGLTQLARLDEAGRRLRDALPLWQADGTMHVWLHAVIRLAAARGQFADALRLVGAEDASPHQFGRQEVHVQVTRAESERMIAAALPDAAQREQWRLEGESLDESSVMALCLSVAGAEPNEP